MKKTAILAGLLCLVASASPGGTISPGLEQMMQNMDDRDEIRVLVVLEDQADIATLDQDFRRNKSSRSDRHRTIVEALKAKAAHSQASLEQHLDAQMHEKAGATSVRGYHAHWLINSMMVTTTVAGVRELALRDDVDVIEPDLEITNTDPVSPPVQVQKDKGVGLGVVQNIKDIQADRVWRELGIDGTGALIGIIDSGVDGNHPALGPKWRGHTAPPEHCWFDAPGLGDTFPIDYHHHGTHVMGTMIGSAIDDTVGVAPGARWIAANGTMLAAIEDFDNQVLSSFEFMTDPDGDPTTLDDVPDVVQCSWGVNENMAGYFDCDSRFWDAIDNCEAAGVAVIFAAGNEGPGPASLRSPPDRATTAYNTFSVGMTNHTAPFEIDPNSSRGPSGCGGPFAVKPEVVAPGALIASTIPDGGYAYLSGTSMAGPHVSGIVALMRAANPDIDVVTMKQILMSTAWDLGAAGEDNDYGYGFVDAYAAVLAASGDFGLLTGQVLDTATGQPVDSATVTASQAGDFDRYSVTDAEGRFAFYLTEGTWDLAATEFSYFAGTASGAVTPGDTTTVDVPADPIPTVVISGVVSRPNGEPSTEGMVHAIDTPLDPVPVGLDGTYNLVVPAGKTYDIQARRNGFLRGYALRAVSADVTVDLQLGIMQHESFETGNLSAWPWETGGHSPWRVQGRDTASDGRFSAKSGAIADNEFSSLSVELDMLEGEFSFWVKTSSEEHQDELQFTIDGTLWIYASGDEPWQRVIVPVTEGTHTFAWTYFKNHTAVVGEDAVWIDFIGSPLYPDLEFTPPWVDQRVYAGGMVQQPIRLENHGSMDLEYTVIPYTSPVPNAGAQEAEPLELAKGEPDPTPGKGPDTGDKTEGGPDIAGYSFKDSDEPDGPVFDWIDITTDGQQHALGDDESVLVGLGITMPYYGQQFTSIYVCSNGFMSFTSDAAPFSNRDIPYSTAPNNLVAPFWDDLAPHQGGTIWTKADSLNGRFIATWEGIPYHSTTRTQTFQAILYDDGSIVFQYLDMDDREEASIGVENWDGFVGLRVGVNWPYVKNQLATRIIPRQNWLQIDHYEGVVPPGQGIDIMMLLDSTDLGPGLHEGFVWVLTNQPGYESWFYPVDLHIATPSGVDGEIPLAWSLGRAVPNPFNPQTTIAFEVPGRGGPVQLEVFDVRGRQVKSLLDKEMPAGRHTVVWDGTDSGGRRVSSGTYMYRMSGGDFHSTGKMVLVK